MGRNYTAVFEDGSAYQVDDVPDNVHPNEALAWTEKKFGKPVKEFLAQDRRMLDEAKQIGKDLVRGPLKAGAAGVEALMDLALPKAGSGESQAPLSEAVERALPTPKNDPRSRQIVRTGVEGATGALLGPGGVSAPIRTALTGAAAGLGSEVGGELTGNSMAGSLAGGLAGGGLAGLAMAPKTTRGALAGQALEGVKDADLAMAQRIMEEARSQGISLNLSQAMPSPSNIDQLVGILANSPNGKEIVRQLRQQPEAVNMAMGGGMSGLPGKVVDPQVAANRMQDATTDIIKDVKSARTALVSPLYNNAGDLGIPTTRSLSTQIDQFNRQAGISPKVVAKAQALQRELLESSANGKPRTDAADIKAAIDSFQGGIKDTMSPLSPQEQGQMKYLVKQLYGNLQSRSPVLKAADKIYSGVSESVVDPLKKSVVGRLATPTGALPDREAARGKVFGILDAGTIPGSKTSEILTLEKSLRGGKQQETFLDTAKTWMAKKVAEASTQQGGRQSEQTAGNIERAFLGDETKQQGFKDVMVGMARAQGLPDDALLGGMQNLLRFVSAAARRPGKVMGTTESALEDASRGKLTRAAGNFSMIQPFRAVGQRLDDALNADAYRFMDRLLTTPEGVATLREMGKTSVMSKKMTDALSTFLATQAADEPAE